MLCCLPLPTAWYWVLRIITQYHTPRVIQLSHPGVMYCSMAAYTLRVTVLYLTLGVHASTPCVHGMSTQCIPTGDVLGQHT